MLHCLKCNDGNFTVQRTYTINVMPVKAKQSSLFDSINVMPVKAKQSSLFDYWYTTENKRC